MRGSWVVHLHSLSGRGHATPNYAGVGPVVFVDSDQDCERGDRTNTPNRRSDPLHIPYRPPAPPFSICSAPTLDLPTLRLSSPCRPFFTTLFSRFFFLSFLPDYDFNAACHLLGHSCTSPLSTLPDLPTCPSHLRTISSIAGHFWPAWHACCSGNPSRPCLRKLNSSGDSGSGAWSK